MTICSSSRLLTFAIFLQLELFLIDYLKNPILVCLHLELIPPWLWNSLPSDIRQAPSLLSFRKMLFLLIGFICIRSSWWTDHSTYSFFEIVSICDLVMILTFYIVYIFRIYRTMTCINWPLAEFLHYLIGTILLLIASIVAAAKSSNSAGLAAGAAFGFLASFLCILSIWLSYKVSCVTQSTVVSGGLYNSNSRRHTRINLYSVCLEIYFCLWQVENSLKIRPQRNRNI
uniref:CKLF like MARVEL transmembrane domain containing 7 n=1 Tax=Anolis carolinensis TaxID=28377 RepID=A0A803T939_ANOCA